MWVSPLRRELREKRKQDEGGGAHVRVSPVGDKLDLGSKAPRLEGCDVCAQPATAS
jgi:hypothetical protein